MPYKIAEIEGIGAVYAQKLATAGITSTADLLRQCGDAKGRRQVGEKTGLSEGQLLEWVNRADLMRISGVGPEFSDLLEASGVDTVRELAMRNAENLAAKMREINEQKKLTRTTPAPKTVQQWITEAARLPAVVAH